MYLKRRYYAAVDIMIAGLVLSSGCNWKIGRISLMNKEEVLATDTSPINRSDSIDCMLPSKTVKAYEQIELSFNDIFKVSNPYDPRQADIQAIFTSPSGQRISIPAFWYQDYEVDTGDFVKKGIPQWRIRFTPIEPGEWKVFITAKTTSQSMEKNVGTFVVEPSTSRGFLRRSYKNPQALEFGNGEPLFALGINAFPGPDLGYNFGDSLTPDSFKQTIHFMEQTAKAGGTFARLRMDSWFIPIESTPDPVAGYEGAGRYNTAAAWASDQIVETARKLGLTLMLCIENANGTVNGDTSKNRVKYNFYMKENGGPLDNIKDFWRNEEIKRLYMQKIRYCVARWGANPAIGVWEFFNEVNVNKGDANAMAAWHKDMSDYWRSIDPYNRPIATSYMGGYVNTPEWWKQWDAPNIDIIQYHTYEFTDMAKGFYQNHSDYIRKANKPLIIGEFGTNKNLREEVVKKEGGNTNIIDKILDPNGLHFHNAIWSSILTGASGALPWFVYSSMEEYGLYTVFTGIRNFTFDWKVNEGPWKPVDIHVDYPERKPGTDRWLPINLPQNEKFTKPNADMFSISRNGQLEETDYPSAWIFGPGAHPEWRLPPTFKVDYPVDGKFIVTVKQVVGKTGEYPLIISVDGIEVLRKNFVVSKDSGIKAENKTQYDNWLITYDEEVAVEIPKGKHTIKVDTLATDRMMVNYHLTSYVDANILPFYRVFALGYGDEIRLWLQNPENTYVNHYQGKPPHDAPKADLIVPLKENGTYRVQWWDTYKGEITLMQIIQAQDNILKAPFGGTLSDVACIIKKVN